MDPDTPAPLIPLEKGEEDFSELVNEQLPVARSIADEGRLEAAVELLLGVEKKARQGSDATSTSRLLVEICALIRRAGRWAMLCEYVVVLMKRRGQLKQAIAKMLQSCMTYLDETPDKATRLELLAALRLVAEGKIYVEIERARLTRMLAAMRESEGKLAEACEVLQEVQVETYGSMDRREKAEFLLEQVRLCLAVDDYVRAKIIANKVNVRVLNERDMADLKLTFYAQLIRYHHHAADYAEIWQAYRHCYNTESVQANSELWSQHLKSLVVYLLLAPRDTEQQDALHKLLADRRLADLPAYAALVRYFTTSELMRWPLLTQLYRAELSEHADLAGDGDAAARRWKDLRTRVTEHNISVVAKYYARVTLPRLALLLDLSPDEAEAALAAMVTNTSNPLYAKIDRTTGVVSFRRSRTAEAVLDDWGRDVSALLTLIDDTTQMVNKEIMIAAARAKEKAK